jgi:folate-binding protein YgfZ
MMSTLQDAERRAKSDAGIRAGWPRDFLAVLGHLGVLQFGGEDAAAFLQGQLSCDVAQVGPRSSSYGAYCTPKGRMLANFLLWRGEAGFCMALSRDLVQVVQARISKFVLRSKVTLSDASEAILLAGAAGAQAERALGELFPDLPTGVGEARSVPGIGAAVRLRDERLFLALPATALRKLEGSITIADARVWRWLDIRAGLPLVTAATHDQFIPQMANLELIGGVSFEKGCYTGQEVVARAQHRGSVKRRMFLANAPAPAQAGDALHSDDLGEQASGMVLNAEASPEGGYDLLAVVQAASRERSTVHLRAPDGPGLRFLSLPYAVP